MPATASRPAPPIRPVHRGDWVQYFEGGPVCIVLEIERTTALLQQNYDPRRKVQNKTRFWKDVWALTHA